MPLAGTSEYVSIPCAKSFLQFPPTGASDMPRLVAVERLVVGQEQRGGIFAPRTSLFLEHSGCDEGAFCSNLTYPGSNGLWVRPTPISLPTASRYGTPLISFTRSEGLGPMILRRRPSAFRRGYHACVVVVDPVDGNLHAEVLVQLQSLLRVAGCVAFHVLRRPPQVIILYPGYVCQGPFILGLQPAS